ncbi:MAG TPA: glycoside hydrolase family 13 protein [Candidatus Limnocylindrales bacterium]
MTSATSKGGPDAARSSGPDWVRDAVFYQIFPDRFASSRRVPKPGPLEPWDAPPTTYGFKGGDLLGIAEHLDELTELGITALYLNPVFASASNHRYHTFDYELVDPLLGGDAGLRELLDEAHTRGMRIILDGVFNHASRGFWPFHHVLENGAASPYRDWFYLDPEVLAGCRGLVAYPGPAVPSGSNAAGAATPGTPPRLGYQAWWDLPALPKLNHSNPAVREYLMAVAERWMRFGIDGWRLDVPDEIGEPGFWEEFRRRVLAVNPDAYLVGELWNPAPEWLAGDRFDATMNYPLTEAILSFVGAGRLDGELVARTHEYGRMVRPIDGPEFGRQLERVMALYPEAVTSVLLNLLDSHDTPRFLSLASGDKSALRLAMLVVMSLPGAPCIYYGDEVGMEGRADPDCRRSYPWDPVRQDLALRAFVAGLTGLRKAEPALRRGHFRLLAAEGRSVAYAMFGEEGEGSGAGRPSAGGRPFDRPIGRSVVVAINAGDQPTRIGIHVPELAGCLAEQLSWPGRGWSSAFAPRMLQGETVEVELGAREGIVIGVAPSR